MQFGDWHLKVPSEPLPNVLFRKALLLRAHGDRNFQRGLFYICQRDPLFWINAFIWQYNPNAIGNGSDEMGPFLLWRNTEDRLRDLFPNAADQEEVVHKLIRCIEGRKDLAIEKSREMGASWICLLVLLWYCLFKRRKKFLAISRSEDAVDNPDDPDCLFWKLDFVLAALPDWMTQGVLRKKLSFRFPATDCVITGQASTARAGVGGRATAMFVDEMAQIKEAGLVRDRTSDTTGCRIFNSTHLGPGTAFARLCDNPYVEKLQLHWTAHPDKRKGLYRYDESRHSVEVLDPAHDYGAEFNFVKSVLPTGGPYPGLRSPWYDRQCERKDGGPRAIAMDLDIDITGSVSQFFSPLLIRSLQKEYCTDPLWEGDVAYDSASGLPLGLSRRQGGPLRLWINLTPRGVPPLGKYCLGADISEGRGATNSCLSGADAMTGVKILEYATPHIPPADLAPVAIALCWLFKSEEGEGALFCWEHHGPGRQFGDALLGLGYRNIYWREGMESLKQGKSSMIPGWFPSVRTKPQLLREYRAALESRKFVNRSEIALSECLAYIYNQRGEVENPMEQDGTDPTGAGVNHGDRVIADGLCWKMVQQMGMIGKTAKEPTEEEAPPGSFGWRRLLRRERALEEV